MSWRKDLPPETGIYLVSIVRERQLGDQAFKYFAHYDSESQQWFKYDPFDDNYEPNEPIDGRITGWTEEVPGVLIN